MRVAHPLGEELCGEGHLVTYVARSAAVRLSHPWSRLHASALIMRNRKTA